MLSDPVFFSMRWVGNEMSDLGAEILSNGSTHVMNKIHQALLKGQKKETSSEILPKKIYKTFYMHIRAN